MQKGIGRKIWYAVFSVVLLIGLGMPARAAEEGNADIVTLQQTTKDTEIKESPDIDAAALTNLPAGTAVIVYGEPQDSWSKVEFKGIKGYIESDSLAPYGSTGELDKELQEVEEDTWRIMDEYELMRKEKRSSIIWATVIALLVIGIFVAGIISSLMRNKAEKEEEEEQEEEE